MDLPELTPEEQAALDFPDDAVEHWMRGEKFDTKLGTWRDLEQENSKLEAEIERLQEGRLK